MTTPPRLTCFIHYMRQKKDQLKVAKNYTLRNSPCSPSANLIQLKPVIVFCIFLFDSRRCVDQLAQTSTEFPLVQTKTNHPHQEYESYKRSSDELTQKNCRVSNSRVSYSLFALWPLPTFQIPFSLHCTKTKRA